MEEFSCLLFDSLDGIGYSPDMIRHRRNYWQEVLKDSIVRNIKMHIIIAGSKAEGITTHFQSDVDIMYLYKDAICTGDTAAVSQIPDITVLHTDTRDAPPGYTRLKLISCNGALSREDVEECIFESESRDLYLSSSIFACFLKWAVSNEIEGDLSGPALHVSVGWCFDMVPAFFCYYPELLHTWASRPRYHYWPPVNVIEDASSMLVQVVPMGSKGSCDQWREWRFCFIESELKITNSLNEAQMKLYIVLKIIAKEILSEVSCEISSYIMKNLTFWLSELLPGVVFRKENFFSLLVKSLKFLKSSIRRNWLPYYMIPGRNLIAERLTPNARLQLSMLIEEIIQEGPQFLLRCSKLREALITRIKEPEVIIMYAEARNWIELLWCCRSLLLKQQADQSDIDAVTTRLNDHVLPEWRMIIRCGIPLEIFVDVVIERIRTILS